MSSESSAAEIKIRSVYMNDAQPSSWISCGFASSPHSLKSDSTRHYVRYCRDVLNQDVDSSSLGEFVSFRAGNTSFHSAAIPGVSRVGILWWTLDIYLTSLEDRQQMMEALAKFSFTPQGNDEDEYDGEEASGFYDLDGIATQVHNDSNIS